jgi:hypothetical protein
MGFFVSLILRNLILNDTQYTNCSGGKMLSNLGPDEILPANPQWAKPTKKPLKERL